MANEKVVLPKEVAKAIENLRGRGASNHAIYLMTTKNARGLRYYDERVHRPLNKYALSGYDDDNLRKLMAALVNGYEVEQSPEDKLRGLHGNLTHTADEDPRSWGAKKGIEETLEILGITIEGINDR